ncbi:MAG: response regulator [Desulfarculaceae bacterium]
MKTERPLVLLVEDDQDTAVLYTALLAAEGMEVACCRDGHQTLHWWNRSQRRPDLVVLDVSLPDGDGLELLKKLKSLAMSCPPVLVLSAHGDPRMPGRCRDLGVGMFLDKLKDLNHFVTSAKGLLASFPSSQTK